MSDALLVLGLIGAVVVGFWLVQRTRRSQLQVPSEPEPVVKAAPQPERPTGTPQAVAHALKNTTVSSAPPKLAYSQARPAPQPAARPAARASARQQDPYPVTADDPLFIPTLMAVTSNPDPEPERHVHRHEPVQHTPAVHHAPVHHDPAPSHSTTHHSTHTSDHSYHAPDPSPSHSTYDTGGGGGGHDGGSSSGSFD